MASSPPLLRSSVFLYITLLIHTKTQWPLCDELCNRIKFEKKRIKWISTLKVLVFPAFRYLCLLTRCNSAPTQVQHTSAFFRICFPACLIQEFPTQTTVFMAAASEISTLDFWGLWFGGLLNFRVLTLQGSNIRIVGLGMDYDWHRV